MWHWINNWYFFLKALGHDADELDNADSMQMVWFPFLPASGDTPYRHITAQCRRLQKNQIRTKKWGGGHGHGFSVPELPNPSCHAFPLGRTRTTTKKNHNFQPSILSSLDRQMFGYQEGVCVF